MARVERSVQFYEEAALHLAVRLSFRQGQKHASPAPLEQALRQPAAVLTDRVHATGCTPELSVSEAPPDDRHPQALVAALSPRPIERQAHKSQSSRTRGIQ